MESDSNTILDAPHELGIGVGGRCGESLEARLTVYRHKASETELNTATVTPGANCIGEGRGLRRALESESDEGVGHEAFAESGVHRAEQQVGVRGPNYVGRPLIDAALGCQAGLPYRSAAANSDIGSSQTERQAPQGPRDGIGVVQSAKELDSASYLGVQGDG